jgi:hypothetical protein
MWHKDTLHPLQKECLVRLATAGFQDTNFLEKQITWDPSIDLHFNSNSKSQESN